MLDSCRCLWRILRPAVHTVAALSTAESATSMPEIGRAVGLVAWVRRHPDLTCVLMLLVVGGALRLAFAFRAPPLFVGGDSQTYLLPGYDLARGLGFAPILK